MKTGIIRLILICLLLLLMSVTIGIIVVYSPYITPVTQWLIQKTWLPTFHSQRVIYRYPFHLQFEQTTFNRNMPPIQTMDVWINPYQSSLHQLVLDSVLLDDVTLNDQYPLPQALPSIKLNQFAAKNVSFSSEDGFNIQGLDLQIQNPSWNQSAPWFPYGNIQFYADQLSWHGESFSHLLVTGNYQAQGSLIQSLSANWRNAAISLQAEEIGQQWSVTNFTAEKLNLSLSQLRQLTSRFGELIDSHVQQVKRLDLLNCQLTSPHIQLNNFDLSAADFRPDKSDFIWNQSDASLSLDAESIALDQMMWVGPSISLTFTPGKLNITDFNTSAMDGQIHLSGQLTPGNAQIQDLQILGVKLFIEPDSMPDISWLKSVLPTFNQVEVGQLKIRNSQIIQLSHKPYWQISGMNIDAKNALIADHRQWGLWGGSARISANNLSYDDVIATQGLLEMHSEYRHWFLDRLFLPFTHGYVDAQGEWKFGEKGAPWTFSMEADSLPLKLFRALPLKMQGLADISGSIQGLSGDSVILRHTLSGTLNLGIRNGQLQLPPSQPHDFTMDSMTISSDRGKITVPETPLEGEKLEATISGHWDLTQSKEGVLTLSVDHGKQPDQFDLLHPKAPLKAKSTSRELPTIPPLTDKVPIDSPAPNEQPASASPTDDSPVNE